MAWLFSLITIMLENPIVLNAITVFVTAFVTWMFSRQKSKRDLKALDTENEIKASKYYQGLLDDLSTRLDKAISELMLLEERHSKLMDTNRDLVVQLQKFKQLNGKSN